MGAKVIGKRLGVAQKTAQRWLERGVPKGRKEQLETITARSERSYRASQTRGHRARLVEISKRLERVEKDAISGIHRDEETGWILGQAADGGVMRAYRTRKPGGMWEMYWAHANALAGYSSAEEFKAAYESMAELEVEIEW
jgi:hypothetical protein